MDIKPENIFLSLDEQSPNSSMSGGEGEAREAMFLGTKGKKEDEAAKKVEKDKEGSAKAEAEKENDFSPKDKGRSQSTPCQQEETVTPDKAVGEAAAAAATKEWTPPQMVISPTMTPVPMVKGNPAIPKFLPVSPQISYKKPSRSTPLRPMPDLSSPAQQQAQQQPQQLHLNSPRPGSSTSSVSLLVGTPESSKFWDDSTDSGMQSDPSAKSSSPLNK